MKKGIKRYGSYNHLDREPNGILRWGTVLVLLFFVFAVILASIFSFNEVIEGDVIITSQNPPIQIQTKSAGRMSAINYHSGDSIVEGALLATIENPANEGDVAYLKAKLMNDLPIILTMGNLITEFPGQLNLGTSIQPAYNAFLSAYQRLTLDKSFNKNEILQLQLNEQFNSQNRRFEYKEQELQSAKNGLNIKKKNLDRHIYLFSKGVISQHDLEKAENEYCNQ